MSMAASTPRPYPPSSVEELCEQARKRYPKVSDIFVDINYPPSYVIDGVIHTPQDEYPITSDLVMRALEHLSNPAKAMFDEKHDADGRFQLADNSIVRMHAMRCYDGPSLVLRLQSQAVMPFKATGLPADLLDLLKFREGLVLVVGPTGSGKTTMLHSMIRHINDNGPRNHIYTIEDPPEFLHPRGHAIFHQREIGVTASDYQTALTGGLRARPNITLVGEMRDLKTAEATLQMAQLGHLCLSTLHANDTVQAISRIVQMFEAARQQEIKELVRTTLRAVIAIRLVRKRAGGMTAACEVLKMNPAMRTLMDQPPQMHDALDTLIDEGMHTLEWDLARLVRTGVIDKQTAKDTANQPDKLKVDGLA